MVAVVNCIPRIIAISITWQLASGNYLANCHVMIQKVYYMQVIFKQGNLHKLHGLFQLFEGGFHERLKALCSDKMLSVNISKVNFSRNS